MTGLRVVSYGGGVQSTALLVLAAQGRIDYPTFVLSNVGDDSENPGTLEYVRTIAAPYAEANGIDLQIIERVMRSGERRTLLQDLTRDSRTINIPVRMAPDGAPGRRNCTATYKHKVIGKWLREHGATAETPATVAIGISSNEVERLNTRRSEPWETVVYPLVSIGDNTGLRLSRNDCENVIREAGLPIPPKSSCWFCPMHKPSQWEEQARTEPDLFERSCQLEELLNRRRDKLGRDHVYFTRFARPLREVINGNQLTLVDDDGPGGCDSGWCMT